MNRLTAVVITKNEVEVIQDCLKSLDFVDEILVIDSYSEDQTVKIAQKLGATVIKHHFDDFSQIRNFAIKQIKTKWLLFVDADERVSQQLKKEIKQALKQKNEKIGAFSFLRKNYYLGREWPHKELVTKLFLKDKLKGYYGELHETPVFEGEVKRLKGELIHFTHRSLEQMMAKTIIWSEVEARLRLKTNHPPVTWWRLIRVFFTGFLKSFIKEKGFLAGSFGLIESIYQGFSLFITYARLWEMQQKK